MTLKTTPKTLPLSLTSYDVLKTIALILMICDHTGYYFMDNESWMRVLGRFCVPIWFFLIGYARTRDIPLKVLIGAGLISAGTLAAGEVLLPLSILLTLMIGRNFIDMFLRAGRKGGEAMAGLFCLLLILAYPSMLFVEYGTIGLMFTVMGGLCRLRQDYPEVSGTAFDRQIWLFSAASGIVYGVSNALAMAELSGVQFWALVFGLTAVIYVLLRFRGQELPHLSAAAPRAVSAVLKFTGRRTLEIYVIHLLAFKFMAVMLMPERFPLLQWKWVSPAAQGFLDFIFLK